MSSCDLKLNISAVDDDNWMWLFFKTAGETITTVLVVTTVSGLIRKKHHKKPSAGTWKAHRHALIFLE